MTLTARATSEPVVETTKPAARLTVQQQLQLSVAAALLVALYAPTAAWLYERWTLSVWQHAHGLFIPPVVAWLIWQELRGKTDLPVSGSAWGFLLLAPALLLLAVDAGLNTQLLSALSLLLALPALSLLLLGIERTRLIAFPLLFLAFALPIPLGVTEAAMLVLRKLTVALTTPLLPLIGINVYVEGTTLYTARGVFLVADACSGFSTLYAALAVASLTAYSAPNWKRRVLVLAAAAPIALAANVLRVAFLVWIVVWKGQAILDTFIHPLSGMATFALALPVIFWLGGPPATERSRS